MLQIELREGARRQHREIALFAVVQCWVKNLEGIVLRRRDLERLIGLERFKRTRLEWLRDDLKDLFPFQEVLFSSSGKSVYSLWACRREFVLPHGTMNDEARIARFPHAGPAFGILELWSQFDEKVLRKSHPAFTPFVDADIHFDGTVLSTYLALVSQGHMSPREVLYMRKSK